MRALSKFLPENFDSSKPIGLIAGRGVYPKLIADRARSNGIEIRLIAFEGEATDELYYSFPEDQRARINVGKVGKWLKALRRFNCGYTIAAGQVKPGKLFRGLTPDIKAASLLVNLKRKNAHTIFRAIADELTANGQTSLDARAFLDEDLATKGWMTPQFAKIEDTYLQHGIEIATEMARLDVGQGVVVRKGTVIAVEAFEGTDPMLKRAGGFKTDQLIFAKTVKYHQDYRFDVPVFGLRTLEIMKEAGIRAAILKADSVIILEKEVTLSEAKKAKIQLFGF
ncbi:MAG: UDP-2,3-diacylglucosamine diphosphatase LpxI [Opitutales bacterium]|nr:UDP-2,3-diacylglucosamine diphosphatase LpxI [Opitutales bacterium]MDG2253777.1 UDP-2,3-diacylglucosamine diphosphatase LpxI [Opitutaceae bacterium]MBT5169165.1 UDP-2,3-diacylglucosamine diphosphatase LpxI [Opitutales bacterium]MBT5816242.1 UDP-2,3-diacylglucosamine diphosphatase LpxI [Opitutales bacterium]MBT6380211.1 UDP-2,3-diacylglucosamine diphosphatase LpxI [Opitutales bacterium]